MKAEAVEGLHDKLDTKEGHNTFYRIADARLRTAKYCGQMRTVKSITREILMKYEEIRERWETISNGYRAMT